MLESFWKINEIGKLVRGRESNLRSFKIILKDPRNNPHIKKLKGELKHMYRFRLGNLRILYEAAKTLTDNARASLEWLAGDENT